MNKKYEASVIVKIPFFDVDSMGITWHGHYAKYLEIARCALMEKLDYNYNQMRESGYAWPIATMKLKYIRSSIFEQEVKITAELAEYENCIKINYVITDAKTDEVLTKAETMQIAVDMKTRETCYVSPDVFLKKFR
jgi:acyl-CoA thioester hydrolase